MSERNELRLRIDAEKKELEAKLARLRADGTAAANDAAKKLESTLEELDEHLRSGWDNVTEAVAGKLNDWLAKLHSN